MSLRFLLQPLPIVPTHFSPQVLWSCRGFTFQKIREELLFIRFVYKNSAYLTSLKERRNGGVRNQSGMNEVALQHHGHLRLVMVHHHRSQRRQHHVAHSDGLGDDLFQPQSMRRRVRAPEMQFRLLLWGGHAFKHHLKVINFGKRNVKVTGKPVA